MHIDTEPGTPRRRTKMWWTISGCLVTALASIIISAFIYHRPVNVAIRTADKLVSEGKLSEATRVLLEVPVLTPSDMKKIDAARANVQRIEEAHSGAQAVATMYRALKDCGSPSCFDATLKANTPLGKTPEQVATFDVFAKTYKHVISERGNVASKLVNLQKTAEQTSRARARHADGKADARRELGVWAQTYRTATFSDIGPMEAELSVLKSKTAQLIPFIEQRAAEIQILLKELAELKGHLGKTVCHEAVTLNRVALLFNELARKNAPSLGELKGEFNSIIDSKRKPCVDEMTNLIGPGRYSRHATGFYNLPQDIQNFIDAGIAERETGRSPQ